MKKYLIRILSFYFLTIFQISTVYSQNSDSTVEKLEEAGKLFETGEESKSLELYKSILDDEPENIEALWNTVVIYAKMGHRQESEEDRKRHYENALELAKRALEHHPESGYAHYAMAVAKARLTNVMDSGDRISASNDIKEHISKATDELEDFAPAWHLFGVWHSDVANVSGLEKTAAGLFSEGLPDASNEKAEEYLKKAISLNEDTILFRLDLAKHYLKTDEKVKAREVLEDVLELDPKLKGDEEMLKEAEEILSDLE